MGEVCARNLIIAYADETVSEALQRMSLYDVGRLPVVERDSPFHLIGMLRRSDIIRAYNQALNRHLERRHHTQQARLSTLARMPVEEARVEPDSLPAGRAVSEVNWPGEIIVASIRRGRKIIVPHGSTTIRPGDYIVYVAASNPASNQVRELCQRGKAAVEAAAAEMNTTETTGAESPAQAEVEKRNEEDPPDPGTT